MRCRSSCGQGQDPRRSSSRRGSSPLAWASWGRRGGCSAGLDDGLGGRCVWLPCLGRSESGPACFARDEQRCALSQMRRRRESGQQWSSCEGGEALQCRCCEAWPTGAKRAAGEDTAECFGGGGRARRRHALGNGCRIARCRDCNPHRCAAGAGEEVMCRVRRAALCLSEADMAQPSRACFSLHAHPCRQGGYQATHAAEPERPCSLNQYSSHSHELHLYPIPRTCTESTKRRRNPRLHTKCSDPLTSSPTPSPELASGIRTPITAFLPTQGCIILHKIPTNPILRHASTSRQEDLQNAVYRQLATCKHHPSKNRRTTAAS